MSANDIEYGPVYIIGGLHQGRIGYYDDTHSVFSNEEEAVYLQEATGWVDYEDYDPEDDDHLDDDGKRVQVLEVAIVYFGDYSLSDYYSYIPFEFLRPVTTDDLFRRRKELSRTQGLFADTDDLACEEKLEYLRELHYVDTVLVDRMVEVRYSNRTSGANVFISHSSRDKKFARWLATDLKAAGHTPWLDEWAISVGESIPQKVSQGIKKSDFLMVILSEHSVNSMWVEREWQAKYWDEVQNSVVHVLPILFENCVVPELLKTKRYADFRNNYNDGLEDLLLAIDKLKPDVVEPLAGCEVSTKCQRHKENKE